MGDKPGKAQALNSLASAYYRQEQWNTAEKVYLMSLTVYRELGDRHGEGRTFFNLALLMMHQQKLDEALIFAREAVKAFAQTEDKGNLAVAKELVKD